MQKIKGPLEERHYKLLMVEKEIEAVVNMEDIENF